MNLIHRLIDRAEVCFGLRTHHFEAAHRVLFEAFLLALCAVPSVVGWRSAVAALLVNELRLRAAETGRRKASILERAREAGIAIEPRLVSSKRQELERIKEEEAWHAWAWPGLAAFVAAAESGELPLAAALAITATIFRAAYDREWIPRWRRSRLAWKAERAGLAEFVVAAPFGYLQVTCGTFGWVDDIEDATRMAAPEAYWSLERVRPAGLFHGVEVRHVRGGES